MFFLVYKITNTANGKIYIGVHKTTNIDDGYMGSGKLITRAQRKYGVGAFTKEILRVCDTQEEMFMLEKELVDSEFVGRADTYNIKLGGDGGWDHIPSKKGIALSEEQKRKQSETRKKLNLRTWLGRTLKEESKKKISENHADFTGGNHPRAKKISIDGVVYDTQKLASNLIGVPPMTIHRRLKSNKWPTWVEIQPKC